MAERLNDAARNRQSDSIGDDFNNGTLKIYTGSQPAAGAAATGTLLVTITLPADAMGAAASGVASKSGTWSGTAGNTGTAGWFRIESSAGSRWYDGAVTATGGGGEIELTSTSITSGQTVTITSFSVTQPAS
ncbi:MAG TPA: hypothetical protein VF290_02425 [Pyrinomonadaceae bacterium]